MMASPASEFPVFAALVLAAGRSSRMGRPKLLLPWGKTSVLGQLLRQWHNLAATQVAVVCAGDDAIVAAELDRLGVCAADRIYNPLPEQGMFSSIQCAAAWSRWKAEVSHWAVVLGDQPHLQDSTLQRLLALAEKNPGKVCQPASGGHLRHPVVLPKDLFLALAHSTAGNLKEALRTAEIASFEPDDAGLDLDIDRPEDYQRALKFKPGKRCKTK